jgi:hypothetical protein
MTDPDARPDTRPAPDPLPEPPGSLAADAVELLRVICLGTLLSGAGLAGMALIRFGLGN